MPLGGEPIGGGPISGTPGTPEAPTTPPPTTAGAECPAIAGSGAETDLLNDALGQIGERPIAAIDDGTVNATYCLRFYPKLRDGLLRAHHWKFATFTVGLGQVAVPPSFEFVYAYQLPSDYLKIVGYNGSPLTTVGFTMDYYGYVFRAYRIQGSTLVTNDSAVVLEYVRRMTDPTTWDAMFYQACGTWLASKLASAITKDHKMSMALMQNANEQLSMAMAVDGQERSVEPMRVPNLIWGR